MKVLGDVAQVIDCEHKTAPQADGEHYGYSVGTRAVRNGQIKLDKAKPISRTTFDQWTRRGVPVPGDLILSREAPMGEVGAVPVGTPVCLGQRTVLLRVSRDIVDPHFVLYQLLAPATQVRIQANSAGSTVKHLNVADVRKIPLRFIPDLVEQRRIIEILEDHLSRLDVAGDAMEKNLLRAMSWRSAHVDRLVWGGNYDTAAVSTLLREAMRNGRSDRAANEGEQGTRALTLTAVTKRSFIDDYTKLTATTRERAADLWLRESSHQNVSVLNCGFPTAVSGFSHQMGFR